MAETPRTIVICSCEDTMPLDRGAVAKACRGATVETARQLCRMELERFRKIAASGADLTIGCTQESRLFAERLAEDLRGADGRNTRETACWSKDAAAAAPKMAALSAAPIEPMPEPPFVELSSHGVALLYGRDEQAIEAGQLLAEQLDITVL